MTNKYTDKDLEFLRLNYPDYGPKYCGTVLGRDENNIQTKAKRMGLKKIGVKKHPSMQKVNPLQFLDIKTKEVAYFLGYFWADGTISYRKNKTCNNYTIAMEICAEDATDISDVVNVLGSWSKVNRKRCESWKETTNINTNSKDIYEFLKEHDYGDKSFCEPTKILNAIPEQLRHYWWRGYFDGDGSLAYADFDEGRWKALQFSSTYNYAWTELVKLCKDLEIKGFFIQNTISKKGHKSGKLTIGQIEEIKKFINFLLKSDIGLRRKTQKLNGFFARFS